MPIPILIWVIGGVVSLFGAAVVFAQWDEICAFFAGKQMAILGPRQVGKTTLINFLQHGSIPSEYTATLAEIATNAKRVKLKDLKCLLKSSYDVPGMEDAYNQWKTLVKESDIIISGLCS
jgi:GTPase SAR1 family protein